MVNKKKLQRFLKRVMDIMGSGAGLIILSPVILITAHKISKEMGKPVFFNRLRAGQNGKSFNFYKFRTMTDAKDKEGKAITEDTEQDFVDFLKKNDVKHRGFTIGYTDEAQFRWSYALDIKSKTYDDLTKDMNSRCKRSIKKSISQKIVKFLMHGFKIEFRFFYS